MSFKKNIIAFFVISILGTIGHFIFEWTGQNEIIGLFFPVNESVWEHLKLLFFPTVIYSIGEYLLSEEKPKNYLPATVIGIICGMFFIVAVYYILNGVLGYDIEFVNIASYYVAVLVSIIKKNKVIKSGKYHSKTANIFFAIILGIFAILFPVFSFNPLSFGIFTPPMTV